MIDTYAINFIYMEKIREKKAIWSCFSLFRQRERKREREQLLSIFSSSCREPWKVRVYICCYLCLLAWKEANISIDCVDFEVFHLR